MIRGMKLIASCEKLLGIAESLRQYLGREETTDVLGTLERLEIAVELVEKAWSGSWLGYHANTYYQGLQTPPKTVQFSQEYGLTDTFTGQRTSVWAEFDPETVIAKICEHAGIDDLEPVRTHHDETFRQFKAWKSNALSIIRCREQADAILERLGLEIGKLEFPNRQEILETFMPKGKLVTRDAVAATAGICTPPHKAVLVDVMVTRQALATLGNLADLLQAAGTQLSQRSQRLDVLPTVTLPR